MEEEQNIKNNTNEKSNEIENQKQEELVKEYKIGKSSAKRKYDDKEYRTGFSGWGNSGNSNKSKELYKTYKAAYDDVKDFLKSLDL